jgi:uncharacterized repeat protein (TIGR01451 family)
VVNICEQYLCFIRTKILWGIFLTLAVAPAMANLVTNPFFNGPTGWTYSLPTYVTYSAALQGTPPAAITSAGGTTELQSGCIGAACMTFPLTIGTSAGALQTITTQIGEGYVLSYWSFGSGQNTSTTSIYWGNTSVSALGTPVPAGWTYQSVDLGLATTTSSTLTVLMRDDPSYSGVTNMRIEPYPKVNVTKTGPSTAPAGTTTSFTVTVSNQSSAVTATTVTLSDTLSAGATLGSVTCAAAGGASCPGSLALPIAMASLPPSSTLTYTVPVGISASTSGTLTNVASINSTKISPVTSVTTGTANVLVTNVANLSLSKTNGTNSVTAGGTTAYTLTVTNSGPGNANGAVLKDAPSAGLNCIAASCSASALASCTPGLPTVAALTGAGWAIPSLPANSTVTVTLTCQIIATGT